MDFNNLTDMSLPIMERLQALLAWLVQDTDHEGWDTIKLGQVDLKLLSASLETQSVRYVFNIAPSLCNRVGNLHGGAASSLFDTLTTSALLTIARPGYWDTLGVSRTLMVTFLRPLPMGTEVILDCEVVAAGKKMANLKGIMRTADGKACVTCVHDKAAFEVPKL